MVYIDTKTKMIKISWFQSTKKSHLLISWTKFVKSRCENVISWMIERSDFSLKVIL